MIYNYAFKIAYNFDDSDMDATRTFIEETDNPHMSIPCIAFLNFMRASGYVVSNKVDDDMFGAAVVDLLQGKTS